MKYSKKQGSAFVVMIFVLATVIVGVLGYLVWSNLFASKTTNVEQVSELKNVTNQENVGTPDLLSYSPAIEIKNSTDTAQLTDAPESFKSFIINDINERNEKIKAQSPDCFSVITVNAIYLQRFASGGVSAGGTCAGGAASLWALKNEIWVLVASSQNIGFECEKLEEYQVPSKIAGATCVTKDPAYPEGKPYIRD